MHIATDDYNNNTTHKDNHNDCDNIKHIFGRMINLYSLHNKSDLRVIASTKFPFPSYQLRLLFVIMKPYNGKQMKIKLNTTTSTSSGNVIEASYTIFKHPYKNSPPAPIAKYQLKTYFTERFLDHEVIEEIAAKHGIAIFFSGFERNHQRTTGE